MKVWGTSMFFVRGKQRRAIVAAKTKKAAAEAFGVSLYAFNQFAEETGNEHEINTATAKPGAVFAADISCPRPNAVYKEVCQTT